MKIINVPIEPLEERYSIDWDRWFIKEFTEANLKFKTIYGGQTSGKIRKGAFLDIVETNIYKVQQLEQILQEMVSPTKEKTVIFLHDLWFPGLANIAYIRDGLGLDNVKICGCLHAGTYDPHDFLTKKGMTDWAEMMEFSWFASIVDEIYVATEFHKDLVTIARAPKSVKVTGFPMYTKRSIPKISSFKTVVFPHRLDSEKQPELFDTLDRWVRVPGTRFVKSKEVTSTKEEYYNLLEESKIAVSFALQETWGIAMQEAVLAGCIPLVPDRLSYSEMYPEQFLYKSLDELVQKTEDFLTKDLSSTHQSLYFLQESILKKGREAIPNIISNIQNL